MSDFIIHGVRLVLVAVVLAGVSTTVAGAAPSTSKSAPVVQQAKPTATSTVAPKPASSSQSGREVTLNGQILGMDTMPDRPMVMIRTGDAEVMLRFPNQTMVTPLALSDRIRVTGIQGSDGVVDVTRVEKTGTEVPASKTATEKGNRNGNSNDNLNENENTNDNVNDNAGDNGNGNGNSNGNGNGNTNDNN
ncbi:MAG: hypothetical protein U0821_09545 [Chloroflexota bacterium]